MKLTRHGFGGFFAAILIVLIIGGFTSHQLIVSEQREQTVASLDAVLHSVHQALRGWMSKNRETAGYWANADEIRFLTNELAKHQDDAEALATSAEQKQLRKLMLPVLKAFAYRGFFIISRNGINLGSSRDANLGVPSLLLRQKMFLNAIWQGKTAISVPQPSDVPLRDSLGELRDGYPTMFVGAPIFGSHGQTIGALTFRIDPTEALYEPLKQGRIGDSGESYAINAAGMLLTNSRFEKDLMKAGLIKADQHSMLNIAVRDPGVNLLEQPLSADLTSLPLTYMADRLTKGESGHNLDGYRDYRGVPVVGSWLWGAEMNLGIATEMDADEADSLTEFSKWVIVAYSLLAALLLAVMTYVFENSRKRLQAFQDHLQDEVDHRTRELGAALGNMCDGLFMVDGDLNFTVFNDRVKEWYPSAPGVVEKGKPLRGLLEARAARGEYGEGDPKEQIEARMAGYHDHAAHTVIDHIHDGRVIEAKRTPLADGGIVVVCSDVTERYRNEEKLNELNQSLERRVAERTAELERSERYNRMLFEESPVGLVLTTEEGDICDANAAFAGVAGRGVDVLLGMNVADLTSDEFVEEDARQKSALDDTGRYGPYEKEFVSGSGQRVPVVLSGLFVERDGTRFIWSSVEDISDRKAAAQRIMEARDAAERANHAKSEFLANMSHELRTPLNAVIGYAEMLHEEAEDDGNDETLGDLDRILGASKHLLSLINNILDISKIEAGHVELFHETMDLRDLVADVAAVAEPLVARSESELVVECAPGIGEITTDVQRLRQVLVNLMSNAAKFTKKGEVRFGVERVNGEDGADADSIVFHVTDTGIGMSESQLDSVFERFTQADSSTTRKFGGTGLGLAIVQELCELLGGSVAAESTEDVGTTFSVTIPSHPKEIMPQLNGKTTAPAVAEVTHLDRPRALKRGLPDMEEGVKVLIIDDDPDNLEVLTHHLERQGIQAIPCESGEEGLELARKYLPDLVILDILMPEMDGWQVLKDIHAIPELASTPVILCSLLDESRRGYVLGASGYIQKPIQKSALMDVVNRHIKHSEDDQPHALVIEDDPASRNLLATMLKKQGFLVSSAENGVKGLECLSEKRPDLIMLDLMMPEMDGFTFLEERVRRDLAQDVPVIVVTAKEMTPEETKRMENRVVETFQKGAYSKDHLLTTISRLIEPRKDDVA